MAEVAFQCSKWWHSRHRLKGYVSVVVAGKAEFGDTLSLDSAKDRHTFAKEVIARLNGSAPPLEEIERRLVVLMEQAEVEPDRTDAADPEADPDAGGAVATGRGDNQTTRLVALALEQAHLLHDAQSDSFARLDRNGHRETWPVRSRGFRLWLAGLNYEHFGSAVSGQVISDALNVIEAQARFGSPCLPVHLRLAPDGDGGLYLDLGDPDWQAVHITSVDWSINESPPVSFRRSSGLLPLPEPKRGGDLALLRSFINLPDDDAWTMVKAWIAATLCEAGPYPVLATYGEHGAAKTSLQKILRRLIDPAKPDLRGNPKEIRDLSIAARNCWICAFDNVSRIEPWLSDALCRLSTGAGWATRELYSDLDEVLFEAQRPVMLNGITESITRPDLLDRSVQLFLPEIDDRTRKQERTFWADFERARPLILGAILDTIVGALREFPNVSLARAPRMADFAAWAVAAERGRGEKACFLDVCFAARDDAHHQAIESSLIGPGFRTFVEAELWSSPTWQGTATELLAKIEEYADQKLKQNKFWPKTGRGLSSELRRLKPAIKGALGIKVDLDTREAGTGRRLIFISKGGPDPEAGGKPARPSQPPPDLAPTSSASPNDDIAPANDEFCADAEPPASGPGGDGLASQPSHPEGQPSHPRVSRDGPAEIRDGWPADFARPSHQPSQISAGPLRGDDEETLSNERQIRANEGIGDPASSARDAGDGCDGVPPTSVTGPAFLDNAPAQTRLFSAPETVVSAPTTLHATEELGGRPSRPSLPGAAGPEPETDSSRDIQEALPAKAVAARPSQPSRLSAGLRWSEPVLIRDAAALRAVIPELLFAPRVGVDTETTGLDPRLDRIRLLQLAVPGRVYVVDADQVELQPLAPIFVAGPQLVAHNAKFDLQFLAGLGLSISKGARLFDTMLAAQLLGAGTPEGRLDHCSLAAVVKRLLDITLDKSLQKADWAGELSSEQLRYAARDAQILLPLADRLTADLEQAQLNRVAEVEMGAVPAIAWLEAAGAPFAGAEWTGLSDGAVIEQVQLEHEMAQFAGAIDLLGDSTINWASPAQVLRILKGRGHDIGSTDEATLQRLVVHDPLVPLLLQHREATKKASVYGIEFLQHVHPSTGRIHPDYLQLGAATGRMSCAKPNLQQVPRDLRYRACFQPGAGRVLVKADYSQIELRIAAQIARDVRMLEAYGAGEDLHVVTAASVLGRSNGAVTPEDRQAAKALNFGLIYGMGAATLREHAAAGYGVNLIEAEAVRFRERFFATYPGLRRWHRSQVDGPVDTRSLTGRRRLGVGRFTEKLNTPVQATGADGLKAALALLWETRAQCPSAVPVLCVHDEIVLECDEGEAEQARDWLVDCMERGMQAVLTQVPVVVEAKVIRDWSGAA
jgi:DNA polymerase I